MSNEEISRKHAWQYYQHADNLMHQRHNIFIVAQSIFFAAFTQAGNDKPMVKIVIAIAGSVYAICWWWLSVRLRHRMKQIEKHLNKDKIYQEYYLRAFDSTASDSWGKRFSNWLKKKVSARLVLNTLLPWFTIASWIFLILFDRGLAICCFIIKG